MSNYLENIQSMESVGTSIQNDALPSSSIILETSGDAPTLTSVQPSVAEKIIPDTALYSAPKKVIIRTYRLRK